jgi:hypothetical protein
MEPNPQTMPEHVHTEDEAAPQRKPWTPPELKTLEVDGTEFANGFFY